MLLPSRGDEIQSKKIMKICVLIIILILFFGFIREASPYLFEPNPATLDEEIEIVEVASGLGKPTCLTWISSEWLLVCDTHTQSILALELSEEGFSNPIQLISNLNNPHGVLLWEDMEKQIQKIFVSQAGELISWQIISGQSPTNWNFGELERVIEGVATGNHQQNAIIQGPNNTLFWHSGSTCNVCEEDDERSATLIEVNPETGNYSIIATGVRNSFDGVWVPDVGYIFTDNGHDWSGESYPPEEINLLEIGGFYGWPNVTEENPIPLGSIPPIGNYTPHSSVNGIDIRPSNSTLPGGNITLYATVFGSWNTVIPVGKEIIRIDLIEDPSHPQGWGVEITVVVEDLATPLPLKFHPNGDLYFAEYAHGTLYKLT
ncbi:MAG: Uncharacterised protein [Methanobacteriota archaeon]|nr:MAG: Uncharacterised protein [Euryarchaeota archaeon]